MQCECIGTNKKTEYEFILQSGHKIQGIYSEVKFQGGYGTGYRWIQAELPKNLEVLVCLRHLCVCMHAHLCLCVWVSVYALRYKDQRSAFGGALSYELRTFFGI